MEKELIITLPEDWSEVTLEQYQTYEQLPEDATLEDAVIAFTGLTKEMLRLLQKDEVGKLYEHYRNLLEIPTDKLTVVPRITIDDIEYGFIPNLDKISYGEYLDIVDYIKDYQSMPLAMEVLYRVIDKESVSKKGLKQYSIVPYGDVELTGEVGKKIGMDVVFGTIVFFYNLTNQLLINFPNYMKKAAMWKPTEEDISKTSHKSGDLTNPYIHSLKETLEGLTTLLPSH